MILLFTSFFTIVTFHSEEGRTIGNLKKNEPDCHDSDKVLACRAGVFFFQKRDPKVHEGGAGKGGRAGRKRKKNSFPPFPLPYFDASTSPLESIFDSPQLLVSPKSISIAQRNMPALRANTAPLGVH